MAWLKSRLVEVRERPFLAVLVASLIVVMALRTPAQNGSRWDSILAGAAWILVVVCAVVALLGGSRGDKSVDE
jgi:ABC-type Co2+ transport system permease subunit